MIRLDACESRFILSGFIDNNPLSVPKSISSLDRRQALLSVSRSPSGRNRLSYTSVESLSVNNRYRPFSDGIHRFPLLSSASVSGTLEIICGEE